MRNNERVFGMIKILLHVKKLYFLYIKWLLGTYLNFLYHNLSSISTQCFDAILCISIVYATRGISVGLKTVYWTLA